MIQQVNEDFEARPITSKCSRNDKRRLASQGGNRLPVKVQTNTNFYQPDYKGVTLEQFFKAQLQQVQSEKPNNFRISQASRNGYRKAGVSHDNHNQQNGNLYDVKSGTFQRKEGFTDKEILQQRYALQDPTKAQEMYTGDDFMRASETNDYFRRTSQLEGKFFNMKNEINQRFQQQEQELISKYAQKFHIQPEGLKKMNIKLLALQQRTNIRLKDIYAKLK